MFHSPASIVDHILLKRLDDYADGFTAAGNADLTGDEVTLPWHVNVDLTGGVLVGGFNVKVDMTHDGDDWAITGITYGSEFGGPTDDFDVPGLRGRQPDGSLRDALRREIMALIDRDYNALADKATIEARAA